MPEPCIIPADISRRADDDVIVVVVTKALHSGQTLFLTYSPKVLRHHSYVHLYYISRES